MRFTVFFVRCISWITYFPHKSLRYFSSTTDTSLINKSHHFTLSRLNLVKNKVRCQVTKMIAALLLLIANVPRVIADTSTKTHDTLKTAINEWNMPVGVTEISREVFSLHMIIFWICVAIAVVVFGVMFWSLIKYRHSKKHKAANFHENTLVEIIWTAVPILILVGMAVPATATLKKMYDPSDADIDILVTGYQWRWRYEHINEEISYFSNFATPEDEIRNVAEKSEQYLLQVDNPLVVPINKKIRFLLTSNDVIHSWWVPELAVKKDAIPGFINESWTRITEPGLYRGQCTELCGRNHGFMPVVIKAVSEDDYQTFVASQRADVIAQQQASTQTKSMTELMSSGEQVYATYCSACHQANGMGIPPAFPALAGSKIATTAEGRQQHIDIVLYGKAGTAMPAFGDMLSAADVAAVVTYERNAWGNNTNDLVQPSEITAISEGKLTAAKE